MDLFRVKDVPQKTLDWLEAQAEKGHIWILGGIDETDIYFLLPLLEKAGEKEVTIHLDSCGGICALFQYIKELCPKIARTIAYQVCESTALSIFTLGKERYCYPYTHFMHHQSAAGREGYSNGKEAREVSLWMTALDQSSCEQLSCASKRDYVWWIEQIAEGKEHVFLGIAAKEIGLATHLL